MRISLKVESDINIPARMKAIRDPKLWKFAASEWHRLCDPYVPMRTGVLKDTVDIRPNEIVYRAPYARYQYEGNFNHRKDLHPKASRQWDKAAMPTEAPKLIRSMQRYIDSGRVKLDG